MLESVFNSVDISSDEEVAVKRHNAGFTAEKEKSGVEAGANRFSLGIQSANTTLHQMLGRSALYEEVEAMLNGLADNSASVVIDLLYGLHGQTEKILIDDIRYIIKEMCIAGLNLYELRKFPYSSLGKVIEQRKMPQMPELPEKARLSGAI